MMNFLVSFWIFYVLVITSILAVFLLLVSYQRERQNLLLRSCCVAVLIMYAFIISGHIIHAGQLHEDTSFCGMQAFILNFLYICIQAHAFFLMLNNCYIALNWKLRLLEGSRFRELLFTVLSYFLPSSCILVFWVTALSSSVGDPNYEITPGPFFCAIMRPRFLMTTVWLIIFAVPGSLFALYLLTRMWSSRQKMLRLKTSSQMTLAYLARYSLSTCVYVGLSYGMIIKLLAAGNRDPIINTSTMANSFTSPWINPEMCIARPQGNFSELFNYELLCPGILSFFPAIVGIAMFLMFGFGTHAQNAYRHFYNKFFHRTKRRASTYPLMEANMTVFQRAHGPPSILTVVGDEGSSQPTRSNTLLDEFIQQNA